MVENKEIMAKNIKFYMELKRVNSSEVCKALGIKQNTFSNWINAKIYPRIDKIEMLANYFGVKKSDLVEDKPKVFKDDELRRTMDLSFEECLIIECYRSSADQIKEAAKRLLAYYEKIGK